MIPTLEPMPSPLDQINALLQQAALAFTHKDNAAARQFTEQALAIDPDSHKALDLLGVIVGEREGKMEAGVALLERAIQGEPRDILYRSHLIQLLINDGQRDKALQAFEGAKHMLAEALSVQPDHYEAMKWSAILHSYFNDYAVAKSYFERALEVNPHAADLWFSLAQMNERLGDLQGSVDCLWRVAADGSIPHAKENLAICLKGQNKVFEAIVMYQGAQKDYPAQTGLLYEEGELRLLVGNYLSGWPLYEKRWAYHPMGAPETKQAFWTLDDHLQGKSILVFSDQGIGDTVMFMRYLPLLKARGATIHVGIRSTLVQLCLNMGVISGYTLEDPHPDAPPQAEVVCDHMIPMGSLATAFKTELATIPNAPYLTAPPDRRAFWRERLSKFKGKKIGIVWSGNPGQKSDFRRSMTFKQFFEPLATPALDNVHFINLQKFPRPTDVDDLSASRVIDWMPEVRDYADTAALMAELDLVVSVCTSSVHVAGAMGLPVWVLLSFAADWRWLLDREDSPWYPSATLIRQPKPTDWASVMQTVHARLIDFSST